MHADNAFRPRGGRSDLVHIQIAGVAGQDGAGLGNLVELAENVHLDRHILEHGFDDQIAIGQIVHVQRRGQPAHAGFDLFHAETALLGAILVILADHAHAAIKRILLHLDDGDGDANRQEVHRNAAAHGAGTDHADLLHGQRLHVGRQAIDLGSGAFGEEDMALRGGLQTGHQLHELAAFDLQALLERQGDRRLDALDVGFRRVKALERLGIGLAHVGEERRQIGRAAAQLAVVIAHLLQRALFGQHLAGEGDSAGGQITVHHFVHQPGGQRILGAHLRAAGHHFGGFLRANDARQALRAAGAGQQAQLHFRQAEFGLGIAHPIMRAQRHFQAAAQGGAVDGGDDGDGRTFHGILHGRQ